MGFVIGIDLGTTYSCVAVFRKQRPEVIPNEQGNRTTPSCVGFTDTEQLVGEAAANQLPLNITNTVYGVKRLIGRKFQEKSVQDDMKTWPFKVVDRGDTKPMVMVTYEDTNKTYFPEEISSRVLEKMKQYAEARLGVLVTDAVITVPAYFSDAQRQATKVAGKIAGLNVLRIINEPTAAALAYGMDNTEENYNILVYDLGGGTFDVSIVNMENGVFDVRATSGDSHLGGEDFTNRLTEHFIDQIKTSLEVDISSEHTSRAYLKIACELAKRQLSSAMTAVVHLNSPTVNYTGNITRALFDQLNSDLFNSTLSSVKDALEMANMDKSDINHVVLIGGSTRIPRVQNILREYFGEDKLNSTIDPDEAVAIGAAIQGALLCEQEVECLQDIVLMDVTPLSLGTNIINGEMSVIIPRNTRIPANETKRYITVSDNQSSMSIAIFEGESERCSDNNELGYFFLDGLTRAPKGDVKVDVAFQIDCDGILHVTANEMNCNNSKSTTVVINKDRLSDDLVNELIENARRNREQNAGQGRIVAAKNELENFCLETIAAIQNEDNINEPDKEIVLNECSDAIRWMKSERICSVQEVERRRNMLVELLNTYT